MTTDDVLDRLNANGLPVLTPGAPFLLQALSSGDNDLQQLVEVVERFPSVTLRLVSLANSGWSSPASPIDSLTGACARLGRDIVRTVGIALTVAAPFDLRRCPGFDGERYWMHAMLTASAAQAFATRSMMDAAVDPQAAHTAGLLYNIGLVWLASQLPREMDAIFALQQADAERSLGGLLRDRLGIDHVLAGAHLGRAWGLPEPILDAMTHGGSEDGDAPTPIGSVVRAAMAMASILLDDEEAPRQAPKHQALRNGKMSPYVDAVSDQLSGQITGVRALARELFAA